MDLGKKAALVPRSAVGHAQPTPDRATARPPPPASSAGPCAPPAAAAVRCLGGHCPAPAIQDFTFASPFPLLLCLDYLAALAR